MIFITLGNLKQPFHRLLQAVDEAAAAGAFGQEEVLVQAGGSAGIPMRYGTMVPVFDQEAYLSAMDRASAVICHCGAGSLFHAFQAGHVPLVMARAPQYGESIEAQADLLEPLAATGRVIPIGNGSDIISNIDWARSLRGTHRISTGKRKLVDLVAARLHEILGPPPLADRTAGTTRGGL